MQKILSAMRRAITDYKMISEGDKIAVGLSGGKDSLTLLTALSLYRRFSSEKFELFAVHVDMNFSDGDKSALDAIAKYCDSLAVPFGVVETEIAKIVFDIRKEDNPCSLCAKLRRGALNTELNRIGVSKLALAHHADDAVETLMLSLIFEGRVSLFQPVSYLDRTAVTLIRPFIYIDEGDIRGAASRHNLPVMKNPCPADKHTRREYVKDLIKSITKEIPFAADRMKSAIFHPERNNLWNPPK